LVFIIGNMPSKLNLNSALERPELLAPAVLEALKGWKGDVGAEDFWKSQMGALWII